MKKVDLGHVITIAANVGVVLGLLLVSFQIHEATRQAVAAAHQARVSEIQESLQQYALSSVLPAIYVKLQQSGLDSLDAEEQSRLVAWEQAREARMEGQYYQHQQGYLDELSYRAMLRAANQQYVELWGKLEVPIEDPAFLETIRNFK